MILFILRRLLQIHASRAFNPSLCFSLHYKIKKDIPGNASKKNTMEANVGGYNDINKSVFSTFIPKKEKIIRNNLLLT